MFNIKNINYCFLLKKGDYKGYVNNIDKVEHLETSDNVDQSK